MKVLAMCLSDASGSPRPSRLINLLASEGHEVDLLGFPLAGTLPIQRHFEIYLPKRALWERAIRFLTGACVALFIRLVPPQPRVAAWFSDWRYDLHGVEKRLLAESYDFIVVEDLQLLPLAFRCHKHAKVLFDAREYYTKQNEESLRFRWFEHPLRMEICRHYLPMCDMLLTVSPWLARAYEEEFGMKMQLLRSTPNFREMPVRETNSSEIKLVHHGEANKNRGIENMIEIVRGLDKRFQLDLYLTGSSRYIEELRALIGDCSRIRIRAPVPLDQILSMLNDYDVGFYYLKPVGFNVTFNLPNKLFEFIQARLAVAIGPSPDMAEVVSRYGCGFVSDEFSLESMMKTLMALTPAKIDQAKKNSDEAAHILCFERESEPLLSALARKAAATKGIR